jgi:hypothetical protein
MVSRREHVGRPIEKLHPVWHEEMLLIVSASAARPTRSRRTATRGPRSSGRRKLRSANETYAHGLAAESNPA